MQKRLQKFFQSNFYVFGILVVIGLNCATLGLSTIKEFNHLSGIFAAIDETCLKIFCLELVLKLYAFRLEFFVGKYRFWNLFDVILILTTTFTPSNFTVLRGFRAFRVLRTLTVIPSMRFVCTLLICSIPQVIPIIILLFMFYYIYGIMCFELFSSSFPEHFGTLGQCFYSLFCIMTLDNGSVIIKDVVVTQPYAWIVFGSFIFISAFIIMNLIIALIINNINDIRELENSDKKDKTAKKYEE